ncbi:DUF2334 domain-containing protein [bacterium]|nr:DUF2334 domain-containing protein [bacterium]
MKTQHQTKSINMLNESKQFFLFCCSLVLIISSCDTKKFVTVEQVAQEVPVIPVIVDKNCVQIFYDTTTDVQYKNLGRTYALMLANLLGHFPEYQQIIGPIDLYQAGDLERCLATFYIGSNYNKTLPPDFLNEYKTTAQRVVWMGYNFWQLGADFENAFGYGVNNGDYVFTGVDTAHTSSDGKHGYYRDILYKGETFYKFSKWSDSTQTTLVAAFEMTKFLRQTNSAASTVMAEAQHSTNNEVIPWALKAQNKFFVTEIPFSYIHEADRYFVFADLIFDFLGAAPKHNAKNAFIRIEDIHSQVELNYLDQAVNILKNNDIVPHIMIIPIYKDPIPNPDVIVRMENEPAFAAAIQRYKSEGSVFIWHGITHQYNDLINPFTGISGDDYEFWNFPNVSPVAEDSPSYVLSKFDDGFSSLAQFSISPKLWVSPHYHASALDNVMFGQMFSWVIGRSVYNDFTISGAKIPDPAKPIYFDANNPATAQNRQDYFSTLQVTDVPGFKQFGQLFPYEIYGDMYGQRLLPENLGNVQPDLNEQVVATRSINKILADAQRNLVLRDVWASVFYHPFLLDPNLNAENAGNPSQTDLERLVKGIKNMGYNFINLETYSAQNTQTVGKPRIELTVIRP